MTKSFFPLFFLIMAASLYSHGQDTSLLKRSPYKLKIAVDKKTSYEEDLKEAPYVLSVESEKMG
ncbi:MAG TPA: hypothetical protein VF939_25740 [Puia sp.]